MGRRKPLFTCDDIEGKRKKRIRLLNRYVPDEKLNKEAEALTLRLVDGVMRTIAATKAALNRRILPQLKEELKYVAYRKLFYSKKMIVMKL